MTRVFYAMLPIVLVIVSAILLFVKEVTIFQFLVLVILSIMMMTLQLIRENLARSENSKH